MAGAKKWTLDFEWEQNRTSEWKAHKMIQKMDPAAAGSRREEQGILYVCSFLSVQAFLFSTEVFFCSCSNISGDSPLLQKSLNF